MKKQKIVRKMSLEEKLELRRNIEETFAFIKYAIKNPKILKHIRNDSTIEILPAGTPLQKARAPKNIQFFSSETSYRPL